MHTIRLFKIAIWSKVFLRTFLALRLEITNYAGVSKSLTTIALFWVVSITKMFNSYIYITNLMYFINTFKAFTRENIRHIEWHTFASFIIFKHVCTCNGKTMCSEVICKNIWVRVRRNGPYTYNFWLLILRLDGSKLENFST